MPTGPCPGSATQVGLVCLRCLWMAELAFFSVFLLFILHDRVFLPLLLFSYVTMLVLQINVEFLMNFKRENKNQQQYSSGLKFKCIDCLHLTQPTTKRDTDIENGKTFYNLEVITLFENTHKTLYFPYSMENYVCSITHR